MRILETAPSWRQAVTFFLGEYLPRHRGVSPNTQQSYTTALQLLLAGLDPKESPHQLGVKEVLAFLDRLERRRKNSPHSRNLRLAALKSFWRAMLLWDPLHKEQYEQLLRIPSKRYTKRAPDYLEAEELAQVFAAIDPRHRQGFRDLTLLRYMFNTGSRISEVTNARLSWLSLEGHPEVSIRGKGGKRRTCPLWKTTAELLHVYLRQERYKPRKGYEDFVFITRLGTGFSRSALWKLLTEYFRRAAKSMVGLERKHLTPHSVRHSTAVHLLRAGVDIHVIKAWLGHADVSTTSEYLDLDLGKKREALEKFLKLDIDRLTCGLKNVETRLPAKVLSWLERL